MLQRFNATISVSIGWLSFPVASVNPRLFRIHPHQFLQSRDSERHPTSRQAKGMSEELCDQHKRMMDQSGMIIANGDLALCSHVLSTS